MPDINMQVFEEAQRNQLVTEVDIQTQVALDDYQVQLSDIANPTQSQDNVVIDRFGEFLPHWNESLDFDTWVKMSMEVAGKRLLMLHGNSSMSSASNGSNVFNFFDMFMGLVLDTTINWDISSGTPTVNDGLSLNDAEIIESKTFTINTGILEFKFNQPDEIGSTVYTLAGLYDSGVNSNTLLNFYSGWDFQTRTTGTSTTTDIGSVAGEHVIKIVKVGGSSAKVYKDGALQTTHSTNVPNSELPIYLRKNGANVCIYEWILSRQYIAAEPTLKIKYTPQNISTALKSLGRAG